MEDIIILEGIQEVSYIWKRHRWCGCDVFRRECRGSSRAVFWWSTVTVPEGEEVNTTMAIVTDPEGFFSLGAGEDLDHLSFPEFMQACVLIVPSFSQGAAQSIFTKLDTNKNGKVSLEVLTQTTEVAMHFYKESKCESCDSQCITDFFCSKGIMFMIALTVT